MSLHLRNFHNRRRVSGRGSLIPATFLLKIPHLFTRERVMPFEGIMEAWHETKDRSVKVTKRSKDAEFIFSEMQ